MFICIFWGLHVDDVMVHAWGKSLAYCWGIGTWFMHILGAWLRHILGIWSSFFGTLLKKLIDDILWYIVYGMIETYHEWYGIWLRHMFWYMVYTCYGTDIWNIHIGWWWYISYSDRDSDSDRLMWQWQWQVDVVGLWDNDSDRLMRQWQW